MNIEVNSKMDKKISMAVFIQFFILTIQYLILLYFNIEKNSIGLVVKLTSKIIVGIFFLRGLKYTFQKQLKIIVMMYGISITIFLLSFLVFPNNLESMKLIIFDFFFMCLPCFIYCYTIDSYKILYSTIEKVGNGIVFIGVSIVVLNLFNILELGSYSMTLSYYLLIPAMINLYKFLEKITMKNFLLLGVSLVAILLIGARGPILCLGVFVVLFLTNNILKRNSIKKMLIYLVIILILMIFILFFRDIMNITNQILESFGIYSRTITLLARDSIHLSGRDELYNSALKLIKEHPIFGVGIAGDRYYLQGYVHNLFLEIILHFGLLLGLILSILLILSFLITSFATDRRVSSFFSMFFCLGVVPLIVSGSYITYTWFWIYIGITTNYIFKKRCSYNDKII